MGNLFKLEIVPDKRMIPVALSATRTVCRQFFDEAATERVALSLEEAIGNITEYCVSDYLDSITVEADVERGAFILTISDKGLPGDLETMLRGESGLGLSLMHKMMDRVSIENLGPLGRKQRLYKYIAEMPAFDSRRQNDESAADANVRLSIRPLREEEAVEVARCIYDEFGFTYPTTSVYYPQEFFAATQRGEIYSLVAVTDENEIAAHLAIWQWSALPGIWEMGMGVVKHRFRNAHIMNRLVTSILEHAQNEMKLSALLCEPVLYHPFTQKIANKQGFHACGAGLSYIPASMNNTINNTCGARNSVGVAMSIFCKAPRTLYLDKEAAPLVKDVAERMALDCRFITEAAPPAPEKSETLYEAYPVFGLGRIVYYRVGADAELRLRVMVAKLKRESIAVIELFIQLNEPGTQTAYAAAKEMGFFCTGFLPMGERGDMLMMENLYTQSVDYDAFQTVEPFTGLIRSIRALDPDQIQESEELQ